MNKKFMTMIAITAISSLFGVNAFGESGTKQDVFIISSVPLNQVDQSYVNLIDPAKTTYVIYKNSNLSASHTSGISIEGNQYNSMTVEGDCLNMYTNGLITSELDSCFQQFSAMPSDFDEIETNNFLILQSK